MSRDRLALAVSEDGRRWLARVPEGDTPKTFRRYGRTYTVVMLMPRRLHARAVRWWRECPRSSLGRAKMSVADNVRRS